MRMNVKIKCLFGKHNYKYIIFYYYDTSHGPRVSSTALNMICKNCRIHKEQIFFGCGKLSANDLGIKNKDWSIYKD